MGVKAAALALTAAAMTTAGAAAQTATAPEEPHVIVYGGTGTSYPSSTGWVVGAYGESPSNGSIYGFDLAIEGEYKDYTYGRFTNPSVSTGISANVLAGRSFRGDDGDFAIALMGLIGFYTAGLECPDGLPASGLGYQCYANYEPESITDLQVGLMGTVNFNDIMVGVRLTSNSEQVLVGFKL